MSSICLFAFSSFSNVNHNPLLYIKYFGSCFKLAVSAFSTLFTAILLCWGYSPTARGKARYISINSNIICKLKLPKGEIGNICIFSRANNVVVGINKGSYRIILDDAVCITALFAAMWLLPIEINGLAGLKMLMPASSSWVRIKKVFRNPAAAFAKIVDNVFENIILGPVKTPTVSDANIYRSPKETQILDKVAPR